jgi:ABC-type branched-subunit amino acid transport system substrate-binding protein
MGPVSSRRQVAVAVTVAAILLLQGCGGGSSSSSDGRETSTLKIPVGPGVTANGITLGILTDLTGASGVQGRSLTEGAQLFWRDQNDAGGVCGRPVNLVIKDHASDEATALSLYSSLQPHVLAFQQLFGSPIAGALSQRVAGDAVPTLPVSWSSRLLSNPYMVLSGTTYELEIINGLDWLMKTQGLKAGDKIGHIYLDGEYGEDALLGAGVAAKAAGFAIVPQKVEPTDSDMTAQVQAIRASGARIILMSTTPPQTASAVAIAEAAGFDVTFMGSNPTFVPSLLEGPAKVTWTKRFWISQSFTPLSGDTTGTVMFRTKYTAAYSGQSANAQAAYGYGQGEIMYQILKAACESGSLKRPALLKALHKLRRVDTNGLIAPLDYSKPGQPPARATYVVQPDASVLGGLKVVQPLTAGPLAHDYKCC